MVFGVDLPMLKNIPTNLVMGFLGVGKTSAILDMLDQKPATEQWAVLVNEFGSIGIDGAIYAAKGVAVKEIPGGCMCCAVGVPLQVAINRLLIETRPQRLLIEPTGLGHPKRVLDTLRGEHFQSVLDIRASICLVDPRKLLDSRYTTHENFIDQIAMADVLVANKTDLANADALRQFDAYADAVEPHKHVVAKTQFGKLNVAWLDLPANFQRQSLHPAHHQSVAPLAASSKDGYQSTGWIFPAETRFDFEKLTSCFQTIEAERIKAVLNTDKGWFVFNAHERQLNTLAIDASADNRLEIISRLLQNQKLEQQVKDCMI
jgi:G3E family GTPase